MYRRLSPNNSGKRTMPIDRITPHCFVGQVTAQKGVDYFMNASIKASCNYVIGKDGDLGVSVDEQNRSWCSSSAANDQRAVTIEIASDTKAPYAITNQAWQALINLCVDICKRNGKTKLLWIANKDQALNYNPAANEMLITVHRWFANKACPGDYIYNRLPELASNVTKLLQNNTGKLYRVQVGAFSSKANADKLAAELRAKGYQTTIKEE